MAAWALSVPHIAFPPLYMAILRGQTGVRAGGLSNETEDHGESRVSMRMLRHACEKLLSLTEAEFWGSGTVTVIALVLFDAEQSRSPSTVAS